MGGQVLNRFGKARVGGIVAAVVYGLITAERGPAADVDPAVAELTTAQSTVELGIGDVSGAGANKLGEYTGFKKQGAFVLGDVDLQGGGSYDSDSTTRWRLRASDLGLGTRAAELDYREQGTFKLNFGYQEFRHNLSDTYQTPYLGAGS